MNFEQLKCFTVLYKSLNYHRAADNLHLTQSAVSQQMKALETELGTKLFTRTTKQVVPTEAGIRFYTHANLILKRLELAKKELQAMEQDLPLRIGYYATMPKESIVKTIAEYKKKYPHVNVSLIICTPETGMSQFTDNQLDVIYTARLNTPKNVEYQYISTENRGYYLLADKKHPLANRECVEIDELDGYDLIIPRFREKVINDDVKQMDFDNRCANSPIHRIDSLESAGILLKANLWCSVVPYYLISEGDDVVRIPILNTKTYDCGILVHQDPSEACRDYIQLVKKLRARQTA